MANTTGSAAQSATSAMAASDAKPWYLSKGVIGGLIAVAVPILSIFFPAARIIDPQTATDWVMKIVQIAGPVIGGLIAVLGRVQATQPIAGSKAAQSVASAFDVGGTAPQGPATSMLDLPLSTIAADLPQVLLVLQNAGQLMAGTMAGASSTPQTPAGAIGSTELPVDPSQLTIAHLETLSKLATKLGEIAPTLAGLVPSQSTGSGRLQPVPVKDAVG